jgi:hypothetical protein
LQLCRIELRVLLITLVSDLFKKQVQRPSQLKGPQNQRASVSYQRKEYELLRSISLNSLSSMLHSKFKSKLLHLTLEPSGELSHSESLSTCSMGEFSNGEIIDKPGAVGDSSATDSDMSTPLGFEVSASFGEIADIESLRIDSDSFIISTGIWLSVSVSSTASRKAGNVGSGEKTNFEDSETGPSLSHMLFSTQGSCSKPNKRKAFKSHISFV